jgi:uncharacterized protein YndB with AHSA1/START domain
MKPTEKSVISVQTVINAPVERVWKCWTTPGDIIQWNHASEEWHTPGAENDLRKGGKFLYRMEARDGSFGFDFGGVYDEVKTNKIIEYTLGDGRKVKITFSLLNDKTEVVETFEAESINPAEIQQEGWQAILDNFKKYVERIK